MPPETLDNVCRLARQNWCLYEPLRAPRPDTMLCDLRVRDYIHKGKDYLLVWRLRVPEPHRRKQYATLAMAALCAEADVWRVPMCLRAVPDLDTIPSDDLVAFYGRFGFVPELIGCRFLLREPKELSCQPTTSP